MREFACRKLGRDCSWRHVAKTEELLTDIVAVHLREAHGIERLTQEMIGRIKNSFSNPSAEVAMEAEPLALKEFDCKDLGFKCDWRYIAQTEELIADGVAVHARSAHGITEFTPEMVAKVKTLAHVWNR